MMIGGPVAIAYVVAAQLGFRFAVTAQQVTTVWAPSGIGIAALLCWGAGMWPAVWAGAFVANAGSDAPLWTAAVIASGNTIEAVTAAWLLRRVAHLDLRLHRIRDVAALVVLGALGSTMTSATIGVAALCLSGVQPWGRVATLWTEWWLGDAVGALIVVPVMLALRQRPRWSPRQVAEHLGLIAAAVVTVHVVFSAAAGSNPGHHPLEYVIFPFVIVAAVRFGRLTTALMILGASAVSVWHTVQGLGPFAGGDVRDSLILLQTFMATLAGTGLLLTAAIAEREVGERRRAAAYATGEALSRADSLAAAAPALLRALCQQLEWQAASLWLRDRADGHLRCLDVWAAPGFEAGAFLEATRQTALPAGRGLPGRVLERGDAVWVENVLHDANFPRAAAAQAAGLHAAFAVPVAFGEEVVGVLECFHRTAVPPDPDLLRTMSTVGSQVGQFLGRQELTAREARARAEAEAANRAKDDFLATLSHELRTPLNAILGWTHMLLSGAVEPGGTRHALEVIDRNAQLQSQLVADILDVSRIITGGLQLERRPVHLGAVVGAALDAVGPAATARQVRLVSRLHSSVRSVEGDAPRLQQIVWNLLANAVKFSDAGGTVLVELSYTATAAVITVRDDGTGIEPSFLPHVFDRFRQGDPSASRKHGGLGLGLAIVQHLVELHGGTVGADSGGPGQGATFTVTLPLRPADTAAAAAAAAPVARADLPI